MKRLALLLLLLLPFSASAGQVIKSGPGSGGGGAGGPSAFFAVSIPADLTSLSSGSNLTFTLDYSDATQSVEWMPAEIDGTTITVPAGISWIRVDAQVGWADSSVDGGGYHILITCTGGCAPQNVTGVLRVGRGTNPLLAASPQSLIHRESFLIDVDPGDTISFGHRHDTGGTTSIEAASTVFQVFGWTD